MLDIGPKCEELRETEIDIFCRVKMKANEWGVFLNNAPQLRGSQGTNVEPPFMYPRHPNAFNLDG